MELIYVTAIGIALAVIVRYLVPGRQTHGILLIPAIGGAGTAVVWVALVWLGLTFDGGWIWVASIVAAAILPRRRKLADEAKFKQLARA